MTVEILENGFHVEGRRMDFVSGEFHYWRVKRENWPKILSRLKALGIRMVSTYVPWNFHLTDHGFDFEGGTDAQRDLRGFIRLVGKGGFKMLLRPGPYIYAEWAFAGAPEHAFKHHKLSEEFRQMAADYIHAVCESCVVPNLATRGGPILAVQVDNEIDPWVRFYSDQMGLSGGQGPFKDYLTQKYPAMEALNRDWGSEYLDFQEVQAFEEQPGSTSEAVDLTGIRRYLAYRSFIDWSIEEIFKWIAKLYRENGVDVPLIMNTYDDLVFHDLAKLGRMADLVCMDIYLSKHLPALELLKLSYWVKAYSAYSKFPMATELQSGIWVDALYGTGPIDGRHEKLMTLAAMAWGLKGWNWYMAVGRDNWTCAPVNEWGLVNPDVYDSMVTVTELYDKIRPYRLRRKTDLSLVHYRPQLLIEDPTKILSGEKGWGNCFRSLHEAGLDFTFYNPEADVEHRGLTIYAGTDLMRSRDAENLLRLSESGSHLVFFRKFPRTDFYGESLNVFSSIPEPIGSIAEPRGSSFRVRLSHGDVERVLSVRGFEYYEDRGEDRFLLQGVPGRSAYVEEEPTFGEHVVGISRPVGAGRITILGLEPTEDVIDFLLKAFKVKVPVRANSPSSYATVHEDVEETGRYVLFLINNADHSQIVSAIVDLPDGSYRFSSLASDQNETLSGGLTRFNVHVDWKAVEIVELAPKR